MKRNKKKKGFTLIELVIVLAVLAIIALIAIPNFNKVRTDSQKKADERTCDVITRITNMAIANEDIVVNDSGTITITPGDNNSISIEVGSGEEKKIEVKGDSYQVALKEVKKPQEKGKTYYKVSITNGKGAESITTTTEKSEATSSSL